MAMFRQALGVFAPFAPDGPGPGAAPPEQAHGGATPGEPVPEPFDRQAEQGFEPPPEAPTGRDEFDEMRRQLDGLQRRIEELSSRR